MARSVKMTVNNNTGKQLILADKKAEHGKFTKVPPATIEASGSWTCTTKTTGTYGPKGIVTYETADKSIKVEFLYDHPMGHGTSSYRVIPNPADSMGYHIKGAFTGHDQDITFELYPV